MGSVAGPEPAAAVHLNAKSAVSEEEQPDAVSSPTLTPRSEMEACSVSSAAGESTGVIKLVAAFASGSERSCVNCPGPRIPHHCKRSASLAEQIKLLASRRPPQRRLLRVPVNPPRVANAVPVPQHSSDAQA